MPGPFLLNRLPAMKAFNRWALCAAVFFTFSAQTPAPTIAIPMKAPRHLEYDFIVSWHSAGEAHNSGFNGDGSGGIGAGIISVKGGGGRTGTIAADIVAITNDGGLVVRINEAVHDADRPGETFTCVVYPDTHKSCQDLPRSESNAADRTIGVISGETPRNKRRSICT